MCQVLDADLRPAAGMGSRAVAAAQRLVEALHALDFTSADVEARHLRLRLPKGAHEEPALLLLFPEAVKDGAARGAAERKAEADRLARLVAD
jgi:hypothetical protein